MIFLNFFEVSFFFSLNRLNRGSVLRILDSKENEDKTIIKNAPSLIDFLSPSSLERYKNIRHGLTILKIPFVENPTLVRVRKNFKK